MGKTFFRNFTSSEDGIAALEFAFLAPFLIVTLVGMIDYGFYINERMQLENISRAAAEYVLKGGNEANVMTDVVGASPNLTPEELLEISAEAATTCECSDGTEVICGTTCPDGGYLRQYYSFSMTRTYTPMFPYPGIPASIVLVGNARLQVQ